MKNIKIGLGVYPKMVQEFASENFNLKFLSGGCLAITFLALVLCAFALKRGPTVIALDGNGERVPVLDRVTDVQVEAAIKEYVNHRYVWSDKNISDELKIAEDFIDPSLLQSFRRAMVETVKYVKEKKVNQRMYPRGKAIVDFKLGSIAIVADRFTDFDGLKAATEASIKFMFALGRRTATNPWGIYILQEIESGGAR